MTKLSPSEKQYLLELLKEDYDHQYVKENQKFLDFNIRLQEKVLEHKVERGGYRHG